VARIISPRVPVIWSICIVHDQRRRQRDDVAGAAHQQPAVVEAAPEHLVAAAAGGIAARRQLDRADQPEVADVDHVGQALQRMQPFLPVFAQPRWRARTGASA
jgi:hypothetical protein